MKLRIGVDFDNTIACYDEVFPEVAHLLGLLSGEHSRTKAGVKEKILALADGDFAWQKLQGQAYGKYMHLARCFAGFAEFLCLSRLRGHEVFVVSHKSEFGHFDEDRIPLRSAAMKWMRETGLVSASNHFLAGKDVYFEPGREAKIARIDSLACTHFVDDLLEVLAEPSFPERTNKILFDPQRVAPATAGIRPAHSWREITRHLFGEWSEEDVCATVKSRFQSLDISQAKLRKGRGNSQVYELISGGNRRYALKIYPDRQIDPRPRLQTEFAACKTLSAAEFSVTSPVASDGTLDWGIYDWVNGTPIDTPDAAFIDEAAAFIQGLKRKGRTLRLSSEFPAASEACLSGAAIASQIQTRLDRLGQIDVPALSEFLNAALLPAFEAVSRTAKKQIGPLFDTPLTRGRQILSPSDFGAHNAIRDTTGRIVFIDFEYFGWDDPVKLVCDFYWHPGMNLPGPFKEHWVGLSKTIFNDDSSFDSRLEAYLPLYGLRWCLILLNEFLPSRFSQRVHADGQKQAERDAILSTQLKKSRILLTQILEK
jgi:hypothetical protein